MDAKNQIKAIANSVKKILCEEICAHDCSDVTLCDTIMQASKILYDDGVRKIDEGSTIISKQKLLEIAKDYEEMAEIFSKNPNFENHTGDPDWN